MNTHSGTDTEAEAHTDKYTCGWTHTQEQSHMHTPAQTHTCSQLTSDTPLFLVQPVLETLVSARNTHTVSSAR